MTEPIAVPSVDLLALKNILLNESDTLSRGIAADGIAEFSDNNEKTWVVTIYDYLWNDLGELGDDLMELTGTDPRNNLPTATLKVKGGSQHIDTFKNCKDTMVGITVETGALRLAYYVDTFDWEYSEAEWVGTAQLKGIWDILNYLVIWPNFLFPIQIQIPSHAIFIGPIVTVINAMIAECALRIQIGLWEFVNNALSLNPDIRAWFGTLLLGNSNFFEQLHTPVYVSWTNPFLDGSPLVARTVRMESCGQVIQDITRAYGVDVRVELWLPGDDQPDEMTEAFAIMRLTQPTYVVKVVDRSQIEGPTKTILDSVLRTVVDVLGSFFGEIGPLVTSVPGMQGVFVSPLLGINYVPPWAVIIAPDIGEKGSVATCKLSFHTPKGWQHIIGGRCVSGDTLVHTADGLLEAKTLDGQEVMTLSQGGVYRPARWKSYGEQQLFKVTFRNGDEIYATAGHEWVVTGEDERVTTLDLIGPRVPHIGHRVPHITHGDVEVYSVYATDRIETVYCCEEPETNTWVTGSGYLTGNSPKWLNDLMNALFGWLLDAISIFIGLIGIPSDLLSGLLNNAILAFQLMESFTRRNAVGPYHPAIEVMHPTARAPYNIETIFDFINVLWDSRGYMSGQFTFRDGDVYKYGKDIMRGGLVSLVFDGRKKLFTDYVENCLFRYTPDARDVFVQVGDGKAEESPVAKHQRFLTALFETISVVTLSPQS